ncbi:MAG TPA: DUF6600 domain-containing protein [Kofleriaceae bacterium]
MKVASILLGATLALAPFSASAQLRVDVYAEVVPGEAIGSVDVFYDQLAPYGVWVDDPRFGQLWIPGRADYVPYRNGHWQFTDVGMVWVSNERFAWVTSHYGRWFYSDTYGRWVWMPDTTWGPSWVEWRETANEFGWAPLAPQIVIEAGYQPPIIAWHYCPSAYIVNVNVARYYVPRQRVIEIHREARPVQQYATIASTKVVVGPSPATLRAHKVTVKKQTVQPRALGRMTRNELQTAETRARERRPQIEQQNQRRIEKDPKLRKVARDVMPAPSTERAAPQPRSRAPEQPTKQQRAEEPQRQPVQPRAQQEQGRKQQQQQRREQPQQQRRIEPPQQQPRVEQPQRQPRAEQPQQQRREQPQQQRRVEQPQPQPSADQPRQQPRSESTKRREPPRDNKRK